MVVAEIEAPGGGPIGEGELGRRRPTECNEAGGEGEAAARASPHDGSRQGERTGSPRW